MYLQISGNGDFFESGTQVMHGCLSSARVVRRPLKCGNERNPYRKLYIFRDCPSDRWEEGGDDVKSARPLHLGQHTSYNGVHNGSRRGNPELILIKLASVQIEG